MPLVKKVYIKKPLATAVPFSQRQGHFSDGRAIRWKAASAAENAALVGGTGVGAAAAAAGDEEDGD